MTATVFETLPPAVHKPGDPFRVFDCARLASDEGRRWVEANLCPRAARTARCSLNSVGLMRGRRLRDGREMLDEAEAGMASLAGSTDPALYALLERWFHSALAYYFYAQKDLDGAEAGMVRAEQAAVTAVSLQPFLVPVAGSCSELHMNRARIAASARRWGVMMEHLDTGVRMGVGEMPFCTLPDGTQLWQADVERFIGALPAEETSKWDEFNHIFDHEGTRRYFDRLVRQIMCMTNLVIQYP